MDNTVNDLCELIEELARATERSPSTISRLATGSGDTLRRLRATGPDGRPLHRITTERASRATKKLSEMWPVGTPLPARFEQIAKRS